MKSMKLRMLLMGTIMTILGLVFFAIQGDAIRPLALSGVGVIFLVAGALWK